MCRTHWTRNWCVDCHHPISTIRTAFICADNSNCRRTESYTDNDLPSTSCEKCIEKKRLEEEELKKKKNK